MWQAIRYRRLQALALLGLAALVTTCAVLTPLYDRAMLQALTRATLVATGVPDTSVLISTLPALGDDRVAHDGTPSLARIARVLPASARPAFLPPIADISVVTTEQGPEQGSTVGSVVWRAGECDHLVLVSGACPTASRQVLVSTADAAHFGLHVGSTRSIKEDTDDVNQGTSTSVHVVGVYRLRPGDYWGSLEATGQSGLSVPQSIGQRYHDAWLTAEATFATVGAKTYRAGHSSLWVDPQVSVDYVLDRSAFDADRALSLGGVVRRVQDALRGQVGSEYDDPSVPPVVLTSRLPALGDAVARARDQARITVPLLMLQLGLLGVVVLVLVAGAALEQRRPEVALARLRGRGSRGARRLLTRELLPAVLAGVPVGIVLAVAVSAVMRRTILRGQAPFELGWGSVAAVALSVATVTAVVWLLAWRVAREPVQGLLRRVPVRLPGVGLAAVDAMVIAVCATAVVAFVTGGLTGPLALAAPGLLALLVGLLLAHLVVPVTTWLGRRLLRRQRYAAAVIALSSARRPATRRLVAIATVASALLVFSVDALAAGARNRTAVAEQTVGAPMTADVTVADVRVLKTALGGPDARHVTPLVRVPAANGSSIDTVAVLPDAYRRIALFPLQDTSQVPWSRLSPPAGHPTRLVGTRLRLRLDVRKLYAPGGVPPGLELDVVRADGREASIRLGAIPPPRTTTLRARVPCARGCTVEGLTVTSADGATVIADLVLSGFRVADGRTDLPATTDSWQPEDNTVTTPPVQVTRAGGGRLELAVYNPFNGDVRVLSRYLSAVVPALVTPQDGIGYTTASFAGRGLTGNDQSLGVTGPITRVPGPSQLAALVDLDVLSHRGTDLASDAQVQVLFDSDSPALLARVRARLTAAGIAVDHVSRVSDLEVGYARSVPTWSLQLGLVAGSAGLLIAALVLVVLAATTWRLRSRDLASLRLSGLSRRKVGLIATGEQLPIVVLAVVAGVACGVVGARFALPTVPLFTHRPTVIPLDFTPAWAPVLVVTAVELVLLGAVARFAGRGIAARSELTRVQEAM